MNRPRDLSVLHVTAARYRPFDRSHVTYGIWRELATGFRHYNVIGRSTAKPVEWSDGNLHIALIPSRASREAEFLFSQFRALPRMFRARPDVIVCQSPVLGGLAALAVARLRGARILMELHGLEFFAPARVGSRLWLLKKLSGFALKRANRIRVLSPGMRDSLARTYGDRLLPRTIVLPPRVDTSRFRAATKRTSKDEPLKVAMVGAVNENKGQSRLIRALEATPFPIELNIAGDGPDIPNCRETVASITEMGSLLRVNFHGRIAHSDVPGFLRRCDLLVMYSRTEATPRSMMEAMAASLPVVTTNAGFCADVVEDGAEGFVLGPEPDTQILEVLRRFNDDRSLLSRMGAAARERACRDYDSVRLFEEYRRLIAETANS